MKHLLRLMWRAAAGAAMLAAAAAYDLRDFNAAAENAIAPNRAAIEHLRSGKTGLAAEEIDEARRRWAALVQQFGGRRPPELDAQTYTATLTTVSAQLVGADIMLKSGRPEAAANALLEVEKLVGELRR